MRAPLATQSTIDLVSERPEPGAHWRDRLGPVLLLLSAFLAIIIFLPPEGRLAVPLHDAMSAFLGRAVFVLPLACAFVGTLMLARTLRPEFALPRRRLFGVGLLLIAVLAGEHVLTGGSDGSGLVGAWLSSSLVDLLGAPIALFLLLIALSVGTWLAFDLNVGLPRSQKTSPGAES